MCTMCGMLSKSTPNGCLKCSREMPELNYKRGGSVLEVSSDMGFFQEITVTGTGTSHSLRKYYP